jgi:hypothetical protein
MCGRFGRAQKMQRTVFPKIIVILLLATSASAAIRLVPAEYATIQAAIDNCNDGDVVIVAPGTYIGDGNRDIDFKGKAITVRSANPKDPKLVAATVVDCNGTEAEPYRGFYFHSGENQNSVLDGLTISNGYSGSPGSSRSQGGAILCDGAAPKILNCIITDNHARSGGGICCNEAADVAIINCTIEHNTCDYSGAGIKCLRSSALITRCVVARNSTTGRFRETGWGAGINCSHCDAMIADCLVFDNVCSYVGGGFDCSYSSARLSNCTFAGNSAEWAGGIYSGYYGDAKITNCIVWENTATEGPQIRVGPGYDVSVRYSDVQGGQANVSISPTATLRWADGNIDMAPGFVDPAANDYHLSANSPCIEAGDPNHVLFPGEADIDGHQRIVNGRVDIGADEFGSVALPILHLWPENLDFFVYEGYGNPLPQLLAVQNRGPGVMNWMVIEDCSWLDVNPIRGQCTDETDYVTVTAGVSGLAAGTYDYQLAADSEGALGAPQVIDVNFVIYGPEIELSATEFEFAAVDGQENPQDQKLIIRNSGGGTLNWSIAVDCDWLRVTPDTGSSRGDSLEATLSVDISALKWANYECDLVIADANSVNSPQTVAVRLHVFAGERVYVPSQVPTIQDAIDHVMERGTVVVADGIYTGEGNRNIDFKGKAITVRSENGPQSCIIDCSDPNDPYYLWGENRGFIFHSGESYNSVVDGFTITNGSSPGCGFIPGGGAILCQSSSPTIANCIIRGNIASDGCVSSESYGGGISLEESSPIIINCIITNNFARELGGGLICLDGSPIISNCIITGNRAWHGAGMTFIRSSPIVTNCTFSANESDAICCFSNSNVMVTNSIFWDNAGPEIYLGLTRRHMTYTAMARISYSNVEGSSEDIYVEPNSTVDWGPGNIDTDPCFLRTGYWDPNYAPEYPTDRFWVDGDYHLKSQAGRWDVNIQAWVQDDVTSPCIDAGDMAGPIGFEPFPNGGIINMGAYGGTAEASKSYFGSPPCETIIAGDINGDCKVDFVDLVFLTGRWLDYVKRPEVHITYPKNGSAIDGLPFEIRVDAWDINGSVVKVEFFANGQKIGEDSDGSNGWAINCQEYVSYICKLTARATDNSGMITISPVVEVRVVLRR